MQKEETRLKVASVRFFILHSAFAQAVLFWNRLSHLKIFQTGGARANLENIGGNKFIFQTNMARKVLFPAQCLLTRPSKKTGRHNFNRTEPGTCTRRIPYLIQRGTLPRWSRMS